MINILGRESEILKYRVSSFFKEACEFYLDIFFYDPNFMKLMDKT